MYIVHALTLYRVVHQSKRLAQDRYQVLIHHYPQNSRKVNIVPSSKLGGLDNSRTTRCYRY